MWHALRTDWCLWSVQRASWRSSHPVVWWTTWILSISLSLSMTLCCISSSRRWASRQKCWLCNPPTSRAFLKRWLFVVHRRNLENPPQPFGSEAEGCWGIVASSEWILDSFLSLHLVQTVPHTTHLKKNLGTKFGLQSLLYHSFVISLTYIVLIPDVLILIIWKDNFPLHF